MSPLQMTWSSAKAAELGAYGFAFRYLSPLGNPCWGCKDHDKKNNDNNIR